MYYSIFIIHENKVIKVGVFHYPDFFDSFNIWIPREAGLFGQFLVAEVVSHDVRVFGRGQEGSPKSKSPVRNYDMITCRQQS